jgi:hypothetical protein
MTVNLLLSVIVGQPPCSGVRQRNFDSNGKNNQASAPALQQLIE